MFKHLFDLSYERNLDEALVFYFFYIIFVYYITGLLTYFVDTYPFVYKYGAWMFFTPFIFYTFISIYIVLKKNLKDNGSMCLIFYTITLTLFIPVILGCYFVCSHFVNGGFKIALKVAFFIWFYPGLAFGGIPATILSTKEDYSLSKEIQKIEQEKLENERWVEKQLLTEHVITSKIEEINKHVNNTEVKEEHNGEE